MATAFQMNAFQLNAFQVTQAVRVDIGGDLGQLDKGLPWQSMRVWLGPTLGWVQEQIQPKSTYATSVVTLGPKDSVALISASSVTVSLPDVAAWLNEPAYAPYNSFGRSLWIKDISGGGNITIVPYAVVFTPGAFQPNTFQIDAFQVLFAHEQTVDGQISYSLSPAYGIARLYPRSDMAGWYVG